MRVNVPTVGVTLDATVGTQGFLCVATAGDSIVTCTGDLNGGESTTLSIRIITTSTTPPQLDVTVTADPANAITETSETDNVATEKTTVDADLVHARTDSGDIARALTKAEADQESLMHLMTKSTGRANAPAAS